jgi:hypothetical protein
MAQTSFCRLNLYFWIQHLNINKLQKKNLIKILFPILHKPKELGSKELELF